MKTLNLLTTISLFVAGFCLAASQAVATPLIDTLNVQGYMKKASGTPVSDGTYTMYIGVFQGGSAVWAKQYAVTVTNGLFSQALSSTGTDLSTTAPVGTGMRSDFHSTTLSAVLLSGATASEVMIRVYSATAIDGANPQFDITLGATPTAMVAALAQGVEDGSLTVASLATSAKATAGGSANKSRIPILDSVNGLLDVTMLPVIDSSTLSNGSITGTGNVTYKGGATSTTTIGDNSSSGTTVIQSGTGGLSETSTGAVTITPGTAGTMTLGNASSTAALTLQTGSGDIKFAPTSGAVRIMQGGLNLVNSGGQITVNSATSGSWSVNLPSADGSGGQFIKTDGSGHLSFGDPTWAVPGAIGSTTPNTGAFTTLSASGQITSTLPDGTAPFVVTSTTNIPNLNASSLNGATFAAPGPIGGTTPDAATFTTETANTSVTTPLVTAPAATAMNITGTTNLTMASAAGSTTAVGPTSGASPITIGGGSSTGAITIGQSTGAQNVSVGSSTSGVALLGATAVGGKLVVGSGGSSISKILICSGSGPAMGTTAANTTTAATNIACAGATAAGKAVCTLSAVDTTAACAPHLIVIPGAGVLAVQARTASVACTAGAAMTLTCLDFEP